MDKAPPLRLFAEEPDDLKIISSALQDAVGKIGGIRYQGRQRRLSIEVNRFRWEVEAGSDASKERIRSILGIDGVTSVKALGLTRDDPDVVISILSIEFEPAEEAPAGTVRVTFAGDGEMALSVECLDISLVDGATAWPTKHTPNHEPRRK
ncbi:MAG: DUF2948 family protein [Pseudomonadota bacterium]